MGRCFALLCHYGCWPPQQPRYLLANRKHCSLFSVPLVNPIYFFSFKFSFAAFFKMTASKVKLTTQQEIFFCTCGIWGRRKNYRKGIRSKRATSLPPELSPKWPPQYRQQTSHTCRSAKKVKKNNQNHTSLAQK